jgi:hypothetical protein
MKKYQVLYIIATRLSEISDDEGLFVREKYAREINRSKNFFTCGGNAQYPVAKYFEVPLATACCWRPISRN